MADAFDCIACGEMAETTLALATGPGRFPGEMARLYLPNSIVREQVGDPNVTVPFCTACIRVIEDNFRATVLYLQAENNQLSIRHRR